MELLPEETCGENTVSDAMEKAAWEKPEILTLPLSKTEGGITGFYETDGVWYSS